jgi:hypothetical protein
MYSVVLDCNVNSPREHSELDAHTSLAVLRSVLCCVVLCCAVLCCALYLPASALERLSAAVVRDWQVATIQRL